MHWAYSKTENFSKTELQQLYLRLSPSRKARIDRLRREKDKLRSLAAELLVYRLLETHYGISSAQLHCKDNGQPYLSDCQLRVSISHCGEALACAVSDSPVGIDIERIRPMDLRICRHTCVPEELEYLLANKQIPELGECSDPDILRRFFEIWTAKEAYYKKCGTGITDLKGINILSLQRQVYTVDDYLIQLVLGTNALPPRHCRNLLAK